MKALRPVKCQYDSIESSTTTGIKSFGMPFTSTQSSLHAASLNMQFPEFRYSISFASFYFLACIFGLRGFPVLLHVTVPALLMNLVQTCLV